MTRPSSHFRFSNLAPDVAEKPVAATRNPSYLRPLSQFRFRNLVPDGA